MLRILSALVAIAVLLVACGTQEMGDVPVEPTDGTPTAPGDGDGASDGEEITGTLEGDAQLEGGCAWLVADDGSRYEVLYPAGYEVRFEPVELMGPDGEVVASEGEEVTVTGRVADDRMSICQVGTIFEADAVE